MTLTINLHHLKKSFGSHQMLRDINLAVNSGEIVGLIGPSGAGKSTVIKTMLGMEKADGGHALVLDTKMPNRPILGQIGYMAQSDALYNDLTGKENLQFFGQLKGLKKSRLTQEIERVTKVVNLGDALGQFVAGYSGGMKRRLSLAIALLGQPDLLILDEPTVGIDPALRRQVWQELGQLRDQGASALVTTHVMSEAEVCNRVALLIGGKIVAFDDPHQLEKQYGVPKIEDVFLKAEKEASQK